MQWMERRWQRDRRGWWYKKNVTLIIEQKRISAFKNSMKRKHEASVPVLQKLKCANSRKVQRLGSTAHLLGSKQKEQPQQQDEQVREFNHLMFFQSTAQPAHWDAAGHDPFRSIHFHPHHHLSPSALRLGADRLPIIAKMRMQLAEITPGALQMFHLLCPRLTFCSRWVTGTRLRTPLPLLLLWKKKDSKNN